MNQGQTQRSRIWGSVLWGVALFFCFFPTLFFPPHRDVATFWLLGDAINNGKMPYTALWDLKPPGIYLLYALPAALGATAMESWMVVRFFDVLLLAIGAWLVANLTARLLNEELRGIAALWFIALYLASTLNSLAQAEAWATPFWLLGWWLLLGPRPHQETDSQTPYSLSFSTQPARFFWSGIATAIAFSCKPTSAAPTLGVLCVACVILAREKKGGLAFFLFWWAGFILPLAAMVVWLQRGGAWDAFVEIQRLFVTPYVDSARDDVPTHLQVFIFIMAMYAARFPLAAVLTLFGLASRDVWPRVSRPVLIASLLLALVALWIQNRIFEYHLQILLPIVAIFAVVGSAAFVRLIPVQASFKTLILFAIPILWFFSLRATEVLHAPFYATGHLAQLDWFRALKPRALDIRRETAIEEAGLWMRQQSRPGDTLMVWGFANELYLWSELRPSQRFAFLPPIGARYSPQKWKDEFLANTQQKPPRFFVIIRSEDLGWLGVKGGTPQSALRKWTALNRWFKPRYHRVKSWHDLEIWEYQH